MADERKSTMVELIPELEAIKVESPQFTSHIDEMIAEAKAGEYHDYKNRKYGCGKMALNHLLSVFKTPASLALAARVRDGEFDEPADAEDTAMLKADLAAMVDPNSEEYAKLINALGLD